MVDQKDENILGSIPISVLQYRFRQKLDKLLLVYADTKRVDGVEHFHYNEAYICQYPSTDNIESLINEGKLVVEPRCHLFKSTGKIRDRGVAFRMKGEYLKELYSSVEKVV